MKSQIVSKYIGALVLAAFCFTAIDTWARLPQPIRISVSISFVDQETESIVAKLGRDQKPFILDWNKDTVFTRGGAAVTATALKQGVFAVIHYKRVSFRNPLVKMVIWNDKADAK